MTGKNYSNYRENIKCKNCQKDFISKWKGTKFCDKCKIKKYGISGRIYDKNCLKCGKLFKTKKYKGSKFCCDNCRKLYWFKKELDKNDIVFKLNIKIGSYIFVALKKEKMGRKWIDLLGYNAKQLKEYLENQFKPEMNWGNYGKYWEIDHRIPKSWFKYKKAEDEEFKKCWSLENLQPLELSKNRSKSNHYSS